MNISILGCGWLGLPLAKKLAEEGHVVKGSTTNREKMTQLSSEGILPYLIKLHTEGIQGDITAFLGDADVLIIDIPPGLRGDPDANFIGKIGRLQDYIKKSGVKNVLFVSSTSVYEDSVEIPVYTENDPANGISDGSKQLRSAEELLKNSESFSTSIVRFGGLFGPGRNPVNYLSGKKNIKDPEAPVNLIHLEDCIGIIIEIINKEVWGEVFNAASPEHPTKVEHYSRKASENDLPLPEFDQDQHSKGKIIESVTLEEKLNYSFKKGL
jgi:nucleoside-diphosphate-sugar epimerase